MTKLLTPKQVARAVGVSESTLKRWCDRGRVPVVRTAGGHRRLRMDEVVQCVRDGVFRMENPVALGLPSTTGKGNWTLERAKREIVEPLVDGDYEVTHQVTTDLYVGGHSIAKICDSVISPAMIEIGNMWASGEVAIYQERRAVGIVLRVLHAFHLMMKQPPLDAPAAIGGTATGDRYSLATVMVQLILRESGWRATSLGGPLPFDSLQAAKIAQAPRLFWLSISEVEDREAFLTGYGKLFEASPQSTAMVIGGRGIDAELRGQMRFAACCENLVQLSDFVAALQPASDLKVVRDLGS